ncbi:MAG: YdcF family protein [Chloroflexi bacterium]|nr:YdcF family protein [Chloroflexota bacterium]
MSVRIHPERRASWPSTRLLQRLALGLLLLPVGAVSLSPIGAFLIVEDQLEPAQAVVVLAGGYPTREWEAANVYREGLAPRIVLVPEWFEADGGRDEDDDRPTLAQRRALLIQQGVPASAIVVAQQYACMTADELEIAAGALDAPDRPVILVTSKYHSRRVAALWRQVAPDGPRGLLRPAAGDPFSPDSWWRDHRFVIRVAREYVGLVTARLPLPRVSGACRDRILLVTPLVNWLLK